MSSLIDFDRFSDFFFFPFQKRWTKNPYALARNGFQINRSLSLRLFISIKPSPTPSPSVHLIFRRCNKVVKLNGRFLMTNSELAETLILKNDRLFFSSFDYKGKSVPGKYKVIRGIWFLSYYFLLSSVMEKISKLNYNDLSCEFFFFFLLPGSFYVYLI